MKLWTGGQTGVDRAVLDYAIEQKLPYGGWCPWGGWAEDFPDPPGVLPHYPQLMETPSTQLDQRTAWNVRDSHATLILLSTKSAASPGTTFTQQMAELVFLRPCWVADPFADGSIVHARAWFQQIRTTLAVEPLILNIAGARESECPGIYRRTLQVLPAIVGVS